MTRVPSGTRGVRYYYDSRTVDSDRRALIDRLEAEGVDVVDTASWSTRELTNVYYAEVLPRGTAGTTPPRRAVRGTSRSISFEMGVLVTPDGCFVGEEVERAFDALFPDLYVELYQD
jgi:hypothetical protein